MSPTRREFLSAAAPLAVAAAVPLQAAHAIATAEVRPPQPVIQPCLDDLVDAFKCMIVDQMKAYATRTGGRYSPTHATLTPQLWRVIGKLGLLNTADGAITLAGMAVTMGDAFRMWNPDNPADPAAPSSPTDELAPDEGDFVDLRTHKFVLAHASTIPCGGVDPRLLRVMQKAPYGESPGQIWVEALPSAPVPPDRHPRPLTQFRLLPTVAVGTVEEHVASFRDFMIQAAKFHADFAQRHVPLDVYLRDQAALLAISPPGAVTQFPLGLVCDDQERAAAFDKQLVEATGDDGLPSPRSVSETTAYLEKRLTEELRAAGVAVAPPPGDADVAMFQVRTPSYCGDVDLMTADRGKWRTALESAQRDLLRDVHVRIATGDARVAEVRAFVKIETFSLSLFCYCTMWQPRAPLPTGKSGLENQAGPG